MERGSLVIGFSWLGGLSFLHLSIVGATGCEQSDRISFLYFYFYFISSSRKVFHLFSRSRISKVDACPVEEGKNRPVVKSCFLNCVGCWPCIMDKVVVRLPDSYIMCSSEDVATKFLPIIKRKGEREEKVVMEIVPKQRQKKESYIGFLWRP